MIASALAALTASALAGAAAPIPDTPAGRQARAVLSSLERDHAARTALVRERFAAKALAEVPAEQWVAFLDTLAKQSGGLDPVAVLPESGVNFIVMDTRARARGSFARFYLSLSGDTESGKIADVGVLLVRDPARAAADVFAPAGMTASGNLDLDEVVPNRATGYARRPDDPLGVEPRRSNIMTIAYRGNAAGGGYATAEDLFRFVRALRENRLLKPETTELFTTPKVDFPGTPHPEKYAYGFTIGECGGKRTLGHGGGGPNSGVSSNLYAFADGSWTIAVLTNYDPPGGDDFAWGLCEFLARQ